MARRKSTEPPPRLAVRMTPGSPYHERDATRIEREITRLMIAQGGAVNTAELLEAETPNDAVLHDLFTWDNDKAAYAYRLDEAGKMLRSVEITIVRKEEPKAEDWRRAYLVVREPGERLGRYVPVQTVARTENYLTQVLTRAEREWQAYEQRYQQYRTLPEFADLLDKIARFPVMIREPDMAAD